MAEPPTAPSVIAGKGKRVTGTFLLMLGAGVVLESTRRWMGGAIMLAGATAFLRGLLEARPRSAAHPRPHVAVDPQTESRV
jgi:hypothetical protein